MPTTPAAMGFSALVAITAFLFILWHTWHYDRFRCVVYSKRDWFRALMVQILLAAIGMFVLYTWIEAAILYDEYYTFVVDTTMPTPWQLWTEHHQKMWKASLYLLCTGWCFLQAVHLEEFLYWAYLMQGIRISGGPRWTWAKSPHFKVWIGVFACSWALLFGAVSIETTNLDMMKAYIFIVGSALSCVLACASIILCIVFPRFVRTVESQGANYEVLERLHFFAEMNQIRTFFRVIYSVAFLTLSVDAMTDSKKIYNSTFWSDILDVAGQMSIFCSTCLSVVILLPRNMTSESLPPVQSDNFHPMVPYKRPSATGPDGGFAQRQFYELGDRLNIDKDVLANSLKQEPSYEMKESPRGQYPPQTDSPPLPHTLGYKAGPRGTGDSDGVPHIVVNGVENDRDDGDGPYSPQGNNIPLRVNINQNHGSRRYSQFSSLPNVMARFTSPIETGVADREPSRVFVNTHHEVIRE